MKKNQEGSMLVWAVVIILVLLIIVGVGLSISFSYFNRSLQYKEQQQVYYTAQSALETIVGAMNKADEEQSDLLIPTEKEQTKQIPSISFDGGTGGTLTMESAIGTLTWVENNKLKITVNAKQGKQEYTLYGDVVLMEIRKGERQWVLYQMYDNETNFTIESSSK